MEASDTPTSDSELPPEDNEDEDALVGAPIDDVPRRPPRARCNARRSEDGRFLGYCKNVAGKGTDHTGEGRCEFHGGASTGPDDTAYLEGNDFAAGNPGGGPPELNTNAATAHGATSDLDKLYERLPPERQEHVDRVAESWVEAASADLPDETIEDLARRAALLTARRDQADLDLCERGWVVERDREFETEAGETVTVTTTDLNPVWKRSTADARECRQILHRLGCLPVEARDE